MTDYLSSCWPRRSPDYIEQFAAKHGRPVWKATRVPPSSTKKIVLGEDDTIAIWERWNRGHRAEDLAKTYGISIGQIYRAKDRGRAAAARQRKAAA